MKKAGKLFALLSITLLLSTFLIGVVSAQEEIGEKLLGMSKSFSELFSKTGWTSGEMSASIAKIFLFLIVGFGIMLILGGLFGKNQWIGIVLSFLVAFLATAYITPSEVYSILISYTALGLTITTMVPLAILGALTYRAATASEGKVQLIMLQYFAWILFGVYSIYRVIYDWAYAKEGSGFMNVIILVTAIAAVLIVLLNKKLVGFISGKEAENRGQVIEEKVGSAAKSIKILDKFGREVSK